MLYFGTVYFFVPLLFFLVSKFCLCLLFLLWSRVLVRNYIDNAVTDVFSIKVFILIFEYAKFPCILVHYTCQSCFKTGHQRTAIGNIDAVAVGIDLLRIIRGVLECDLYLNITACPFNIDRRVMERRRITVDKADKALNAVLFLVGTFFIFGFILIDQL